MVQSSRPCRKVPEYYNQMQSAHYHRVAGCEAAESQVRAAARAASMPGYWNV
jgi:hypothetical protein